jgi:GNAT superfamily N-acetyltransferase
VGEGTLTQRNGDDSVSDERVRIVPAREEDVPVVLGLIKGLAEYEKLAHEVVATENDLRESLFGSRPVAEVVLAYAGDLPIGFALFFHNFSTFLGRRGLYLEDLFVVPEWRGRGIGRRLLAHLARMAVERGCGRVEWAVLDWNEPAVGFYRRLGALVMDDWRICRLTGEALAGVASSAPVR